MEVNTLDWAMQHLDPTSAPGFSGLSNLVLKNLSPSVVGPLLRPFFGAGMWDYSKPSHVITHQLLVSVRGVALDKTGEGYADNREVNNLRPICIGESLRRLAGRCQLLQLEGDIGARLAPSGQFGVGFANGTDIRFTSSWIGHSMRSSQTRWQAARQRSTRETRLARFLETLFNAVS
jgi:hypothetical protein